MAPPKPPPTLPPPPPSFTAKKQRILSSLSVPEDSYTDKSPKGSVDVPIIELIDELNGLDGVVTTSSCSGRVAVFVEGPRPAELHDEGDDDGGREEEGEGKVLTGSPAGKGGGCWLFVSHDPVDVPLPVPEGFFTQLCGLSSSMASSSKVSTSTAAPARLVKLSFSPLILHVHCATLQHTKLLLTAAINAGFRESGVQSLRILDDPDAGVTLGIRTAGLGFETVVGQLVCLNEENPAVEGRETEVYEALVSEEYLGDMFRVINERFEWNSRRKERFRSEVRRLFGLGVDGDGPAEWEDKEVRRRRMREQGLRKKMEMKKEQEIVDSNRNDHDESKVEMLAGVFE